MTRTARTENPAGTREKLLDAAQELMLAKGFVATTVDEICERAGLTKGSFFHYFETKDDLGKAALERFSFGFGSAMGAACSGIEDPLDRVLASIDFAIEKSRDPKHQGCLVGTFAQEISTTHPELRQACAASFEGFVQALSRDIALARARHAPKADFDPEQLGEYFLALAQGSLLLMKARKDRKVLERNFLFLKSQVLKLFGK